MITMIKNKMDNDNNPIWNNIKTAKDPCNNVVYNYYDKKDNGDNLKQSNAVYNHQDKNLKWITAIFHIRIKR